MTESIINQSSIRSEIVIFQIKLAMRKWDKTEKHLARALNVSRTTINHYLNLIHPMPLQYVPMIEEELQIKLILK